MKTLTALVAVSALAALLAGCDSTKNTSYKHITGHLTPVMKGLSERPSDDHTAFASASNQNLRMFWDDVGRALYLDTPSRLHPFPVVTTSGQSR